MQKGCFWKGAALFTRREEHERYAASFRKDVGRGSPAASHRTRTDATRVAEMGNGEIEIGGGVVMSEYQW